MYSQVILELLKGGEASTVAVEMAYEAVSYTHTHIHTYTHTHTHTNTHTHTYTHKGGQNYLTLGS